jgi:SAM-dependent methyltransferase
VASYVFREADEAERLCLQAEVWEPAAERMLGRIGVAAGAHCVDLGCGPRGILGPLARRAGPRGHVVGVELLAAQLGAARARAREEGIGAVEIVEADAWDTRLPRAAFDLVHERFLIAPLGRGEELLQEMIALARPGGVVALEEPIHASWEYLPPSPVWTRVKGVFEAVFPRFGGDASAGRSIVGLLRRLGLAEVRVDAAVVGLQDRHPYLRTPLAGLSAMRRYIVEAGLMSDLEIEDALLEMERIAADPETHGITFTLAQAWGRKPPKA